MARYGIINLDKLNELCPTLTDMVRTNVNALYVNDIILSPEETEAKFKQIYFEGAYQGQGIDEWNDFKQTL